MKNKNELLGHVGPNTRLAHLGNAPLENHGFVNPSITRGSTVLFPDTATLRTENQKFTYGTHGTPTTDALCQAVNSLEGSFGTLLVPSGLAAITIPLLSYLKAGDHALIVDSVYFPTRRFCNTTLKNLGIEVTYFDPALGEELESLFKPNTKLVHLEAPGSNTFEMQDIGLLSAISHRHGCIVMMDNTWATPLYFKPLEHGVDVSIHAATKYPSGHSDVLMGFISTNEEHWNALYQTNLNLGICVSPDDAYQVLRGLRTMAIRLEHHNKAALDIAKWLQNRNDVWDVLHPALPEFPTHDIWKRDFTGSSGVFSFVLAADDEKVKSSANAFLDALQIFGLGYSWGGYESLALPVSLGDRTIAKGPQRGALLRLQIGLEDVEDLKADLERGFEAAKKI